MALTIGVVLCALPLFNTIGAESALVVSIVLSPFAAALGARHLITQRAKSGAIDLQVFLQSGLAGVGLVGIPLALLMANALRVRWCEPLEGLLFFLFGPLMGVPLAAVMGCACACLVRSTKRATALAVLLPLLEIGTTLWLLWFEPGIFAYGHFFGYFPGTLYDLGLAFPPVYATFRVTSALMFVGFVMVSTGVGLHGGAELRRWQKVAYVAAGIGLLVMLVVVDGQGPQIGYRTSRSWLRQNLSLHLEGEHCDVHMPRDVPREEARRLLEDCDFRASQVADHLGITLKSRVTVYFFKSAEEKRQLVGAADIMFAKPWHQEAYLQLMPWPHPVLAHELVHVVAAQIGTGPFRVSARLGGLWPEPAIIEGTAVALAWGTIDELTPHQWAKALVAIGKAPSYQEIFGASFLRQAPNQAYTIAGSVIGYIADRYGAGALRHLYTEGDISKATGRDISQLMSEWRAFINQQSLPPAAWALARARFERPGVFYQICPHRIAELQSLLVDDARSGDVHMVLRTCRSILDIDPRYSAAQAMLVWAHAQRKEWRQAEARIRSLHANPDIPRPIVAKSEEALGDTYFEAGDLKQAKIRYDRALREPLAIENRRLLELKALSTRRPKDEAILLRAYLVGQNGVAPQPAWGMYLAQRISEKRTDGLGPYLAARQLINQQAYEPAVPMLRHALDRGLPTPLLAEEADRLLGLALVATRQFSLATTLFQARLSRLVTSGNQFEARDWLERVAYLAGLGAAGT
ncbi:MAG: hypothetical protein H6715_03260 [Myxococcales bacterium]|nr:hypothetical protein [Myxococcales bacterium]MCB9708865.1 hypothetical protein [Myxococcales bacterium]